MATANAINNACDSYLITGTNNLNLSLLSATPAQIDFGGSRFIHNTGTRNTFGGSLAGNTTLSGTNNVGLGTNALTALTSGIRNTAVGYNALTACTSGGNNTALGHSALVSLTTGSWNIALGEGSGNALTGAESHNILIKDTGVVGVSNRISIGVNLPTGHSSFTSTTIKPIRGITTDNADAVAVLIDSGQQLGTVSSSRRYKQQIRSMPKDFSERIHKLRPVRFSYKSDPGIECWGLIAEEVAEVFPELVVYKNGIPETVKYHDLEVLLLRELQALKEELDLSYSAQASKDR